MDARLDHYIDMVRDISAESLPKEQTVALIVEEAKQLFAGGFQLGPHQRIPGTATHGRHLLYEDPCTGFVVIAMVWPAGADSRPHDHGTWGVVGVLEGTLEVTDYERPTPDAPLRETGTLNARPGDVAFVLPPERELHRMRNTSSDLAITVHTYGQAIESCRAFDPTTGTTELIHPTYTSAAAPTSTTS